MDQLSPALIAVFILWRRISVHLSTYDIHHSYCDTVRLIHQIPGEAYRYHRNERSKVLPSCPVIGPENPSSAPSGDTTQSGTMSYSASAFVLDHIRRLCKIEGLDKSFLVLPWVFVCPWMREWNLRVNAIPSHAKLQFSLILTSNKPVL